MELKFSIIHLGDVRFIHLIFYPYLLLAIKMLGSSLLQSFTKK